MLKIQSPIWSLKAVGIAIDNKADHETIRLEIVAQNKKGYRYYPNPFEITVKEIREKKIRIEERRGNRPMLYIVPISALHEIEPETNNQESGPGAPDNGGTGG